MKKLLTCAGVAVVGAASVHAQFVGEKGADKPWSISAKLRGFYDDNYVTQPAGGTIYSSWGTEFAPTFNYNQQFGTTSVNARLGYIGLYYADRPSGTIDNTLQADLGVGHSFGERLKVDVSDSFVRTTEPVLLEPTPVLIAPGKIRTQGDAYRNQGTINGSLTLTEKLGARVRYQNTIKDYLQDGAGSRSALLDSVENTANFDLTWAFTTKVVGLVGYQFTALEMTSKDAIFAGSAVPADIRDSRAHFIYGGTDYTLTEKLNARVRVGAQFTEYPNAVGKPTTTSPYGQFDLSYQYMEGSSAQLGLIHSRNATDVALNSIFGTPTYDAESTTLYATINQKITPKLSGVLRGSWQGSEFNGGQFDGQADNYYSVDVNLSYKLPEFWKLASLYAEVGYSYDKLESDITGRGFDRNRVFFGFRGTL